MSNSGNMKNISELMGIVNEKYTVIPLLQRNYKWTMECAAELAKDLWENFKRDKSRNYQLNMITIYNDEKNNRLQILDGQQRVITLKLLLSYLEPEINNFNFLFERDFTIDERSGRRHFIDYLLKQDAFFGKTKPMHRFSVDTKRLYDNFIAMLIPVSFRDVVELYHKVMQVQLNKENASNDNSPRTLESDKSADTLFKERINAEIVSKTIGMVFVESDSEIYLKDIFFSDDELKKLWSWCQEFNQGVNNKKHQDEDDLNDEVRISSYSQSFMELWTSKVEKLVTKETLSGIRNKILDCKIFTEFIKNKVEVLYHETISEPIDEFLNINENKTRFVISDYIRASMISDNPIENVDEKIKESNQEKRAGVLALYRNLSNYLYNNNYQDMWELVKIRYDDFDKNKDINRLKVVFCDRYSGTSIRGYEFEPELKRLNYFKLILKELSEELNLEQKAREQENEITWNTYNAVYILLECKKKYRFFSLFSSADIEKGASLNDVTARERFCFFEWAYRYTLDSEDPWDISYFLESQLCEEKCDIKKSTDLPKKQINSEEKIENNEWCYVSRGGENDDLYSAVNSLITEKGNIHE